MQTQKFEPQTGEQFRLSESLQGILKQVVVFDKSL